MVIKNKKVYILGAIVLIFSIIVYLIIWENNMIEINEIQISDSNLPSSFSGYRVAHVSDLHNAEFGKGNRRLVEKLSETHPDIIVITGDIVDRRKTDTWVAIDFVKQAVKIAPVYYATGNHEHLIDDLDVFLSQMKDIGVTVLQNEKTVISKGNDKVTIAGINGNVPSVNKALIKLLDDEDGYTVLLSHFPELFHDYYNNKVNLTFSGHVHGGQFRLPFVGGVFAPTQGWFPKYDSGLYENGDSRMVVSRGLGNSLFPFRVNNPPEIVVVELHNK